MRITTLVVNVTSVGSILSPVSRTVVPSRDTNCSAGLPASPLATQGHGGTTRAGGRSEALRAREIDRSKQEWLLRSAELATLETSGLVRRNYFTHCQINILCSSLSAISVMVGNGVNFSYRNINFSLGSRNFLTIQSDLLERLNIRGPNCEISVVMLVIVY